MAVPQVWHLWVKKSGGRRKLRTCARCGQAYPPGMPCALASIGKVLAS